MTKCDVFIWEHKVGQLLLVQNNIYFKFDDKFELEISPVKMPNSKSQYSFKEAHHQFQLPGVFYESLPDKFGMDVMEDYFLKVGVDEEPTIIDKLLFVGDVALGAIKYKPSYMVNKEDKVLYLSAKELQEKAKEIAKEAVYDARELLHVYKSFSPAGGARAKAIVGYCEKDNLFSIGQRGERGKFVPSIVKFDERILGKPQGLALNEFVMMSTARQVGINTPKFYLCKDGDYTHFVIERFDIDQNNNKLHKVSMASLNDYNYLDKSFGYDHIFRTMEKLMLRKKEFEEMFRRMVFNYVYNNHDDHLKNHSFLMNKSGEWHLAPAYDITYLNTIGHMNNFLKINGKQSKNVTLEDFMEIAKRHDIKKPEKIIEEVENGIGFFISSVHEHMKNSLDSEFMIKNVNYLLDSTKKITSIIEQKSLSQLQ